MIDVGAHYGGSLDSFARAGWKVLAFEPDPKNRAHLEAKMRREPDTFAKVTLSPKAVSDEIAEGIPFYASEESTGISGLNAFRASHAEVAQVETISLDAARAEFGLEAIDFLKIDVEGHEMSVLRGLDFEAVRPRAILAEFEDSKTLGHGYSSCDLATFFADKGYTVLVSEWHPIERYGIRHSWHRISRWPCRIPRDSWGNLIAFSEPPDDAKLADAVAGSLKPGEVRQKLIPRIKRSLQKRFGGNR